MDAGFAARIMSLFGKNGWLCWSGKLTSVAEAREQLLFLYKPVLEHVYKLPMRGIIVVKNAPGLGLRIAEDFLEIVSSYGLTHEHGKMDAIVQGFSASRKSSRCGAPGPERFHDYNPAHWELIHVLSTGLYRKSSCSRASATEVKLALQHNQPFFPNNDIIRAAKPASIPIRELKPGVMRRKQQLFPDFTLEASPAALLPRGRLLPCGLELSRASRSPSMLPHRVSR